MKYCFQCYGGEDFDTGVICCECCKIRGKCKMECDTCSEKNKSGCPEYKKDKQRE